jgi:hypothetical protein
MFNWNALLFTDDITVVCIQTVNSFSVQVFREKWGTCLWHMYAFGFISTLPNLVHAFHSLADH